MVPHCGFNTHVPDDERIEALHVLPGHLDILLAKNRFKVLTRIFIELSFSSRFADFFLYSRYGLFCGAWFANIIPHRVTRCYSCLTRLQTVSFEGQKS